MPENVTIAQYIEELTTKATDAGVELILPEQGDATDAQFYQVLARIGLGLNTKIARKERMEEKIARMQALLAAM